jgi:tripartite-type tricarboxylate transporter receptor subunit TctC
MRKDKMLKNLYHFILISLIVVLVGGTNIIAAEQTYPNKPITLWVPFSAGGSVDSSARGIAIFASKYLNTKIIIENMPGADGVICYNKSYTTKPDGYILFTGNVLALIVREFSKEGVKYKARDFKPIFAFTRETSVLVGHPEACKTIQEFLGLARSKTMSVGTTSKYGTSGANGLIFADRAKLKFNWVPFDSGAESLTALAGKHIDAVITTITSSLGLAKGGKIKPLLTFSDKRNPIYPEVPVPDELGIDMPPLHNQVGIMGPPRVTDDKISFLEAAFGKAVEDPEYQKMIKTKGGTTEIVPLPSKEFKKEFDRVYSEMEKYKRYFE